MLAASLQCSGRGCPWTLDGRKKIRFVSLAPVKFYSPKNKTIFLADITAKLEGDTSIGVEKMENENIDIRLQKGVCLLNSIQVKM